MSSIISYNLNDLYIKYLKHLRMLTHFKGRDIVLNLLRHLLLLEKNLHYILTVHIYVYLGVL